jgi:uncharacterized repeat protein (TIGR03803 family)
MIRSNLSWLIAMLAFSLASAANAQDYTVLYNFGPFSSSDGNTPFGSLIQSGSEFYGFAFLGGDGPGSIFQFDPATSAETVLSRLQDIPVFSVVGSPLQSGSNLYGMTNGADGGSGSIFQYNLTTNTDSLLHLFAGGPTDGSKPWGSLIQSGDLLYGMTSNGGVISSVVSPKTGPVYNNGVIFQYNVATNTESVLHSFGASGDGATPDGSLIQIGSQLYGMTSKGGSDGDGAIIDYDTVANTESVLHSFTGGPDDGATPEYGSLLQSGSDLYGMTELGGANGIGTIFDYDLTTNTESVLYSFGSTPGDGGEPLGSLIQSGSLLYGMTADTIFDFNLATDTESTLHTFAGPPSDGFAPYGSLLQVGSTLYGMTSGGGTNGSSFEGGVIFSLTVPEPAPVCLLTLSSFALLLRRRQRIGNRRI